MLHSLNSEEYSAAFHLFFMTVHVTTIVFFIVQQQLQGTVSFPTGIQSAQDGQEKVREMLEVFLLQGKKKKKKSKCFGDSLPLQLNIKAALLFA